MKILFAGKTDFKYNRTKILYEGLKKLKNVDVKLFTLKSKRNFNKKEFKELTKDIDFIYVPPFRFTDARFFKKQTDIPIVFDPLVSVYLTRVVDYKQLWKAPQKYIADWLNLRSCDILIADTQHHKEYYSSKFKIPLSKIFVLPIGADINSFFPKKEKKTDGKFHVGFYGSFIPLQGVHNIIETANILKDDDSIVFEIVGDGHYYKEIQDISEKLKLKNINFHGRLAYEKLPDVINTFDICLGIFGESLKADIVIPNKIYHYSAHKKCTITKETSAIKETFTDKKDIILSSINPSDIKNKIIFLKDNPEKRKQIANNSFSLISNKYNEIKIAERFVEICTKFNID